MATDTQTCLQKFSEAIRQFGFESGFYCFVPNSVLHPDAENQPIIEMTDPARANFLHHYSAENLVANDFIFHAALSGHRDPLPWWHEAQSREVSAVERNVIEVPRYDYDIQNGLTIPVMQDQRGFACVTVFSDLSDSRFTLFLNEDLNSLTLLANALHAKLFSDNQFMTTLFNRIVSINPTEQQVFRHLISGKPMKQIEDHTGISYRYATKVLDKFRKKHGNISKDQLLYSLGHFFF
ncbi:hypothetical protein PRUB_a1505 [Pseudoalteromonas rubra]|uniref:Transcription factor LuxR-like autoinducer-binding domain-containing protein n=1 Tax=Pseudoalteromonas rubra TaxID=43658 RepID=A0A8T0C857_9GAMM|nr:autoinducer binding domain-containing protein [Pseudoalteromonas rubra]KAF7786833.1 hypothetical protein PRUB_a1505 [Pseudoalteromonas rubra]